MTVPAADRPLSAGDANTIAEVAWNAARARSLAEGEDDSGPWPPTAGQYGWQEDDAEACRETEIAKAEAILAAFVRRPAAPDAEGWTEWHGGENPVPGQMVDAQLGFGTFWKCTSEVVGPFWADKGRYRLARPATSAASEVEGVAKIVSDEEVARVHGNANFGAISPREVVNEGVRKTAVGYHCGSTMLRILREHGLITKPRPGTSDCDLTKKGKAYGRALWPALASPPSERERALEARVAELGAQIAWRTDDAPKDGTVIYGHTWSPYRWLPYKPNSEQAKRGAKGRWQTMNEYGGWESAPPPSEWATEDQIATRRALSTQQEPV